MGITTKEHRFHLGGVPATYSRGLVLQRSHQDDFLFWFYPHYFHAHAGNLPEISLRHFLPYIV